MNNFDILNFYKRDKIELHTSKLSEKSDPQILDRLLNQVYSQQLACFLAKSTDYSKILNSKDISHYFYNNCFREIKLFRGNAGKIVTIDEFVNQLMEPFIKETKNRIYYLKGEVGCGKTGLINFLITKYFPSLVVEKQLIFLRIDLHLNVINSDLNIEDLISKIILKFERIILDNSKLFGLRNVDNLINKIKTSIKSNDKLYLLHELIIKVKQNKQFLLIIDNLDGIVHQFDKGLIKKDLEEKYLQITENLIKFIQLFFSDTSKLSNLQAVVLFSLRKSTYNMIHDRAYHSSTGGKYANNNDFSVIQVDWKEVVLSRNELFKFGVDQFLHNENIIKEGEGLYNTFSYTVQNRPTEIIDSLTSISSLSNTVLRELIEFLANYIWLKYRNFTESNNITEAILSKNPITTLAYLLGGKRLYSQQYSRFPNIYLVEANSDEDQFGSMKGLQHSYWLKSLILRYIEKENKGSKAILFQHIKSIFCDFDEKLLETTIANMSDVINSNLISVEFQTSDEGKIINRNLNISRRGEYCLQAIFDKFIYLQIIVDDYNLILPKNVFGEFEHRYILKNDLIDYSYLTGTGTSRDFLELIQRKVIQVLLFLDILEGAYQGEEYIYKETFQNLRNLQIPLPNIQTLRESILIEIKSIYASMTYSKFDFNALLKNINKDSQSRVNKVKNLLIESKSH